MELCWNTECTKAETEQNTALSLKKKPHSRKFVRLSYWRDFHSTITSDIQFIAENEREKEIYESVSFGRWR